MTRVVLSTLREIQAPSIIYVTGNTLSWSKFSTLGILDTLNIVIQAKVSTLYISLLLRQATSIFRDR